MSNRRDERVTREIATPPLGIETDPDDRTPTVPPIRNIANLEQLARIANLLADAAAHAELLKRMYDELRERAEVAPKSWDGKLRAMYAAHIDKAAKNLDALIESQPK